VTDARGRVIRPDAWSAPTLPQPLSLRYAGDIEGPPPAPHWLLDGVLLPGTVCLFCGASNVGKSLATLQMLVAIALGREWLGRVSEQARCLAVFAEDMKERIDSRCLDICAHYEVHNSVLDHELAWLPCPDRETLLWETEYGKGQPTPLFHQLFGGGGYLGNGEVGDRGYRVVLLDTAAAMFDLNHNSTTQVNAAMRALVREAIRHNCVIVVNVHPSRGNKTSFGGSGQWEAVARFGFNLSRPKPPPGLDEEEVMYGDLGLQRIFRGLGSNYAATPRPEKWRWRENVFVLDEMATEPRRPKHYGEMERRDISYRLLEGCARAIKHGVSVSADVLASRSLPNLARAYGDPQIRQVPLNVLYTAQEELLQAGHLVMMRVSGRCLLRPMGGPKYDDETPWVL
jgi:hypothetical protein